MRPTEDQPASMTSDLLPRARASLDPDCLHSGAEFRRIVLGLLQENARLAAGLAVARAMAVANG